MSLRRALLLAVATVVLATSACSNASGTGDKGYIDGEGVITVLPVAKRKPPGEVRGTTLDGDKVDLASYAGKVVVVNVWAAWCPPCRAEADDLAAAAKQLAAKDVVFVGVDVRDPSKDTARAFERRHDVPYSSLYDPSGRTLLAFHGTLTPSSIPSTVVIDQQGRVAASILGRVPSTTTLVDLVDEVSK